MKIHLMVMTAMLSFCITNNCEAQTAEKKDNDAACEKAKDCKSNVCTDKKCAQGTMTGGDGFAEYDEMCASGKRWQPLEDMNKCSLDSDLCRCK